MIEENKIVKRVAVYGRVSTARQEEEETIKTQLVATREFAAQKGYAIIREYVDEGWSGTILARPDLDQLRADASKGLWDAVLIYDPDRLARRYFFQELVMDELREQGIETLFVTVAPSKNQEDQLLYGVRGVFAEYERMKITERFRLGRVRKAKEGHIVTSRSAYGYKLIKRKGRLGDPDFVQTHYEIDEIEARVVRMIFSWIADERLTTRQVVKRLQKEGIPPRQSKRGVWSTSTLNTLLRNKTYIGEAHYASSYAVVPTKPQKKEGYKKVKKTSRKMRPEEEWIKIPVAPLISEDLFERTQKQLKINYELAQRNRKNEYLLSGKIKCVCGNSRAGEGPQRGKHLYYRCTARVHSYPLPPECQQRGLNARIADELVWKKIAAMMSSPELIAKQAERWMESRTTKTINTTVDIEALQKEVVKIEKQEARYVSAYGEGVLSLDKLRELTQPLKKQITHLKGQIAKAELVNAEQVPSSVLTKEEVKEFAKHSAQKLSHLNFESKRAIVMSVVDKIVGSQESLHVYGHIPLKNHVKYETNDRHCRASKCGQIHIVQRAY